MKLDTEWIARVGARTEHAETLLTGGAVLTHRPLRVTSIATVGESEPLSFRKERVYKPSRAPQARWELCLAADA